MPNEEISQIQLPNGDMYDIRDGNVSDFKTNIDEETLSDGQVVKYNEDTGEWENTEDKTEHAGSASGAVATFTTDAALPLKSFECSIVAQQESGTPTPDNPLLITGFSQADIINGTPTTLLGIGYNINTSGKISTTQSDYAIIYIPVIQGEKYLINTNEASLVYAWYEEVPALNVVSYNGQRTIDTVSSNTVTAPITGYLAFRYDTSSSDYGYVGTRVIVSFGQTIYGGRLIYANGQWAIEADKAMTLISDINWNYDSINTRFNTSDLRNIVKNAASTTTPLEGLSCECYVTDVSSSSRQINLSVAVNTSGVMVLKDTNYNDVSSLVSAVGNYKIVYPLATPVIIPLTSTVKVKTISGLNNIYSNTGDVSLEYYKNTIPAQVASYNNTSSGLTSTNVQSAIDELSENGLKITKIASGTVALFSDGADNIPVNSFECSIVAQQESGTPTPESSLPITGFSQADIPVCGLNIFDEEMEAGTLDNSTGETAIDNNKMRSVNFIPVKPNTTYSVYNNTGVNLYIYSYGADKSFIEFDNTGMITGSTFTTDSNTYYIKFRTQNNPSYSNNISINYSSSDDDYHAYTGALYTVSFGQTIYGGRLVYSNGQWSIEATHQYVDLGSLTYGTGSGGNARFAGTLPSTPIVPSSASQVADIISDIYEPTSSTNIFSGSGNYKIAIHTNGLLWIRNTDYSDINTFKTAMNGHCIVYALATPTIIPITSTTKVKTISGLNNIYSNTGDVSLEYFVNKADDIDKLINAEKSTESSDYHTYSTDEQIVGRWIDGSTIYEKVIDLGAMPNNTTKNVAHGISNLGKVLQAELSSSDNSSIWLTIPYATTNTSDTKYQMGFWVTATNIVIKSDWDRSALSGYAILRYTKTSSNTRSLNLSKGSSEETPVEEKKEELKEFEEVKEVQDE